MAWREPVSPIERGDARADRIELLTPSKERELSTDVSWLDSTADEWQCGSILVPLDLAAGTPIRRAPLCEWERHRSTSVPISAALIALVTLPAGELRDYIRAELSAAIDEHVAQHAPAMVERDVDQGDDE